MIGLGPVLAGESSGYFSKTLREDKLSVNDLVNSILWNTYHASFFC